ncbi:MAG TPA: ATP-binding cassette domain-containing protein [bacterium]|mgnify:FL=1|nr:ATP-binding cassette domain-containing protein [bacterium]
MIRFENITISFKGVDIVTDFSLDVKKGEHAVLTGQSGSGKTSILKTLTGVVVPEKGDIFINGIKVDCLSVVETRKKICYVPQKVVFDPDENVRDFIMLPFSFKANRDIVPEESLIKKRLESVGLETDLFDKMMSEVSGGQQQRLAIVRGLLLKREIYLLDEITSNLDGTNKKLIIDIFKNMNDVSILSVGHDEEWINCATSVVDLGKGEK